MTPRFKNLIDGEWVDSASGKTFTNINPANTQDHIGEFSQSDVQDARRAVAAARKAYDGWRLTPAPRRAEILFRVAEALIRQKEQLAQDMTREMGKVLKETRGDVQEAIDMTYYIAGEGRRLHGHTTPSELPNKYMMSARVPLGVAAIITPWNFPMAIPSWKIIPALVTGNTVVFKPSSDAPLSAYNFVKILHECGIPKGVINFFTGTGSGVGAELVTNPDVSIISFTGSTETGRTINQAAAASFKRISLEMGGKNALIIMEDANLDLALDGAVWGGFGTSGQRCTAASRILLHDAVYDKFMDRFVARAKSLRVGDGLKVETEMGPVVNENQLGKVESYVRIGKEEGAKLLCGGERVSSGSHASGHFFAPTIFGDVHRNMRIAREEIFGPVVSVIRIKNLEEAIDI
ncbi:MAG: aldehyde dehydrogenase, partial [Acidobacteria bacterium]